MAPQLRRFDDPKEVILSEEDAYYILIFFWESPKLAPENITTNDIKFAQGILLEAIEASYNMGFIEALFESYKVMFTHKFAKALNTFIEKALKNWFKHATQTDLMNVTIYSSVKNTIALNFRSVWEIRVTTNDPSIL